jgi:hypothetical protein
MCSRDPRIVSKKGSIGSSLAMPGPGSLFALWLYYQHHHNSISESSNTIEELVGSFIEHAHCPGSKSRVSILSFSTTATKPSPAVAQLFLYFSELNRTTLPSS